MFSNNLNQFQTSVSDVCSHCGYCKHCGRSGSFLNYPQYNFGTIGSVGTYPQPVAQNSTSGGSALDRAVVEVGE